MYDVLSAYFPLREGGTMGFSRNPAVGIYPIEWQKYLNMSRRKRRDGEVSA